MTKDVEQGRMRQQGSAPGDIRFGTLSGKLHVWVSMKSSERLRRSNAHHFVSSDVV
jgi:hypothetical protein